MAGVVTTDLKTLLLPQLFPEQNHGRLDSTVIVLLLLLVPVVCCAARMVSTISANGEFGLDGDIGVRARKGFAKNCQLCLRQTKHFVDNCLLLR